MWNKLKIDKWDKFWNLEVIDEISVSWKNRKFLCKCSCWKLTSIFLSNLTRWHTISCWCKKWLHSHWMTWTRINNIFRWIQQRCENVNDTSYKNYWWRWIKCEWNNFKHFYRDMKDWYSDNLTIDRIDVNWNYCKKNCRRITYKEQHRNRRNNIVYEWKLLIEWCEELWLNYNSVYSKMYRWHDLGMLLFNKWLC